MQKTHTSKRGVGVGRAWCLQVSKGGWGWLLLTAAALSHMTTGGMALANVVLLRHMMPIFNGTTPFQAGKN